MLFRVRNISGCGIVGLFTVTNGEHLTGWVCKKDVLVVSGDFPVISRGTMQFALTTDCTSCYLKNKLGAQNWLVSFMQVDKAGAVDADEEAGAANKVKDHIADGSENRAEKTYDGQWGEMECGGVRLGQQRYDGDHKEGGSRHNATSPIGGTMDFEQLDTIRAGLIGHN